MWLEVFIALAIVYTLIWVAATRFVHSRGYAGQYVSFIGKVNPTWDSLLALAKADDPADARKAERLQWTLIVGFVALLGFALFVALSRH